MNEARIQITIAQKQKQTPVQSSRLPDSGENYVGIHSNLIVYMETVVWFTIESYWYDMTLSEKKGTWSDRLFIRTKFFEPWSEMLSDLFILTVPQFWSSLMLNVNNKINEVGKKWWKYEEVTEKRTYMYFLRKKLSLLLYLVLLIEYSSGSKSIIRGYLFSIDEWYFLLHFRYLLMLSPNRCLYDPLEWSIDDWSLVRHFLCT